MKTATQPTPDLQRIADLIDGFRIAMLTTSEDDGVLSSRPMAALEMDTEGAIWFFTDLRSGKVDDLPLANVAFTDSESSTYVSMSGRCEIVTDRSRIHDLWTVFAKPWFPDGPDSPTLGLLKFVPDAADYWDSPDSKMVRAFSVLASVVAGKPVAMGEHGSLTGLSRD